MGNESEFIREITLRIFSSLNVKESLRSTFEYLRDYVPLDLLAILIIDQRLGAIRRIAHAFEEGVVPPEEIIPLPAGMSEKIAARNFSAPFVVDAQHDEIFRSLEPLAKYEGNTDLIVPLRLKEEFLGALCLRAHGEGRYSDRQAEFLAGIAKPFAIALANALAHEKVLITMELEQRISDKEQMLIHQSRMAAMGEMIGYIAHQWRQPLNTLGLIVQELRIYSQQGTFTEEYLDASTSRAMELIAHMSQTVEDFRNFFKPEKEKVRFMIKDVLEQTLKLIKANFSAQHIALDVLMENDCVCEGYPNEYGQVILNILRNVSDVFLERKVGKPNVVIRIFKENERSVMSITDNAGGIPEEIIDKIFDPYFTTKDPEQGTGLGLYMSKAIIEKNMGGRLSVRNTVDGAEFRIEV